MHYHTQFDLFLDDDPSDEDIGDSLAPIHDLKNSVLYHTDWTVETLIGQLRKGRIELNPAFQRRDAWTRKAKSLLIESVLLNFPVPAITLAEKRAERTFIVVDGKQRLSTFAQFFGEMPETKFNSFKLVGLTQLAALNGLTYQDLCERHADLASQLENYSVRTNVIRGWKSDEILFNIFHRLNSGSVKLSPQELRQSLHPGKFTEFIAKYSETSPALRDIFPGDEADFRMRDVELITRYIALVLFIKEYRGDLKRHLDRTVAQLNENWDKYEAPIHSILTRFEDSYTACTTAFSRKHAFRKWNGDDWESRTNRAVFDAVMINLLSDDVLKAFQERGPDIVEKFKQVSLQEAFRNAVEKTTKTTEALYTRISLMQEAFKELGLNTIEIAHSEEQNQITVEL
jgi:hypothetical protein